MAANTPEIGNKQTNKNQNVHWVLAAPSQEQELWLQRLQREQTTTLSKAPLYVRFIVKVIIGTQSLPNSRFPIPSFLTKSREALYSGSWSVGQLVGCVQYWADTNVTLAFEDDQVIQPFSRDVGWSRTFWGLSEGFLGTFRGLSEDFLKTFEGLYDDFLGTFRWISEGFLMTFNGFQSNLWRISEDNSEGFLRTLWGLTEDFLGTFLKDFLKTFIGISKDFLWTFVGLSEDLLRTFWWRSENYLFWKILEDSFSEDFLRTLWGLPHHCSS